MMADEDGRFTVETARAEERARQATAAPEPEPEPAPEPRQKAKPAAGLSGPSKSTGKS